MAKKIVEVQFGNGHPIPKLEVVLSTGYAVDINPKEPVESFRHLARALFGEIFLQVSKSEKSFEPGISATIKEITKIVDRLGTPDLKSLLSVSVWAHFLSEYDLVRRRTMRRTKKKQKE